MSIVGNIEMVRKEIFAAAGSVGRKASEISLVAATKTQNADAVKEAITGGVDACGENRVQELSEKNEQGAYEGRPIHFIGHLQKNKLKKVVGVADLIESADSIELIQDIGRRAMELGIIQDILLQINIGNDPNKFGFLPSEVFEIADKCQLVTGIRVRGLMTILPFGLTRDENRALFANMYKFFVDIKAKTYDNVSTNYLSMGMSDDFREAIMEGANMVRVGSLIFGKRN